MVKFADTVQLKTQGCAKCFSVVYTLPCQINKEIAKYFLQSFGQPKYNLDVQKLFRIDGRDGFHVEGKIDTKNIKLVMPKNLEKADLNTIPRKIEFESCLIAWLSDTLQISIEK